MIPAVRRTALCFAAAVGWAGCLSAAVRGAGADEFPLIVRGGSEWIDVRAAAARWGLSEVPGRGRQVELAGGGRRVLLQGGSREVMVDDLRIFLGNPILAQGGRLYFSLVDDERRLLGRVRPDLCRIPARLPRVIAIDPGHGGEDRGAENKRLGLMEKTFTLEVSLSVRRLLESAGYRVVLTRGTDVDVPKPVRAEIANHANADLFVSVHFNSLAPDTRTTGVEVLTFPPRGQRSDWSWSSAGRDDAERGASPVNAFDPWSAALAGCLHRDLLRTLRTSDRGEKTEHLGVLRGLNCPGALVEPAFLSNDAEARRLSTAVYRQRIAEAIAAGILDYAAEIRSIMLTARRPNASPSRP